MLCYIISDKYHIEILDFRIIGCDFIFRKKERKKNVAQESIIYLINKPAKNDDPLLHMCSGASLQTTDGEATHGSENHSNKVVPLSDEARRVSSCSKMGQYRPHFDPIRRRRWSQRRANKCT